MFDFVGVSDYHGDDNCWDCHEGDEGGCTIPACHPHIYERTPPQTTSNAQPSYAGPATIVLTATDLGEFGGCTLDHGIPANTQQSLVTAHPTAFAASQDHTRDLRHPNVPFPKGLIQLIILLPDQ